MTGHKTEYSDAISSVEEIIADAGEPLEIRWRGNSYLDLPVRE